MNKIFTCCNVIIIVFSSILVNGQSNIDTLKNKSYEEIYQIHTTLLKTDTITAKKALNTYIQKAKNTNDTSKIVLGLEYYSHIATNKTRVQYYDSIIAITKNKQTERYPAYAYFRKAQFYLYQKRNIKKTLSNLNEARKYSEKNKNEDLLYRIEYHIAIIKSEHLNQKELALTIFQKCKAYYEKEKKYAHKFRYLYTIHAIAETHIGLKNKDSATYYNSLGYHKALISNDKDIESMGAYFTLCEGINQYNRKKYISTIDSIHNALPVMIDLADKSNIIDSYFYLGRSFSNLNKTEQAITNFIKTDSLLETLSSIPQYKHVKTYQYLKDYYKSKNDLKNQNKYLNKLNTILDKYLNDREFIAKKVNEDYDVPLLMKEQQVLINNLNKSKDTYLSGIQVMLLLLAIFGGLLIFLFKKNRTHKLRFENLIKDYETKNNSKNIENKKSTHTKTTPISVPAKHISYIMDKLDVFEQDRNFLTPGVTSQSLADDIKTNVKYLSKVINHYKDKSFTNYLNELRIDYAIKELQHNKMLRKFTIKAIAQEFGYNNSETFSNAFYNKVKIKPSYYIRELNKIK